MKTLAILGRESRLCEAELSSLYPTAQHHGLFTIIESEALISIDRLGGTIKLAEVIGELPANASQADIVQATSEYMLEQDHLGKLHFGLSAYGKASTRTSRSAVQKLGLELKKALRKGGRSVRFVEGKGGNELTAAQLKFNQLVTKGFEIIIAHGRDNITFARTYAYQDIDSYSKRDWERPVRDSKVGMLPPKLAQIMINLAQVPAIRPIYDPFCGNGVILQEALLMGYPVFASDHSEAMVDASLQNLDWLRDNYDIGPTSAVWAADAATLASLPEGSTIVTEGFLGTPIHGAIRDSQIDEIVTPVDTLYHTFLKKTRSLMEKNDRMVVSFPTWAKNNGLLHLPVIDQIKQLGYTTEQYSGQNTLVYRRDNQFVGREIAVLVAI